MTGHQLATRFRTDTVLPTIGWGIFCAASWTWCIGMFLPVILLREDGWNGLLAFAIPNLIGCAAFGYVMSRNASRRALWRQPGLLRLFSVVTVAFQLFFVGFLFAALVPWDVSPTAIGLLVLIVSAFVGGHRWRRHVIGDRGRIPWSTLMVVGVGVWLLSMIVFAIVGTGGWGDFESTGRVGSGQVWWLVPIFAFGFLLCPYLDATFHVARVESPSRHAFAIFGVAFALMLLLTAAYASLLLRSGPSWPVIVHLLVQLTFTTAVHIRATHDLGVPDRAAEGVHPRAVASLRSGGIWILWLMAPLLGAVAGSDESAIVGSTAIGATIAGEAWYVRWLAPYGLIFPALLLVLRSSPNGDPARRIVPMAIVVVLGLVVCELGFVHGVRWLLPIPVAAAALVAFWPSSSAQRTPSPFANAREPAAP